MPTRNKEALLGYFNSDQMKHVLYEAAHAARVVLKVEASVIFLITADESLVIASWDGREPLRPSISLESSYVKSLWEGRRSITWNRQDRVKDAEFQAVLESLGLQGGMILPLSMEGWNYGVWLVSSAVERSFTDIDESILSALRDNIVLTTTSLVISEDNYRLQREASALYEINKEISQLMNLNQVLKIICEKTCSLLGAELSYLSLADNEKQELRVVITEGTRADELRKMVLKFGEGVGGAVADNRAPELVDSYPKDKRPKSKLTEAQAASEGIESIVSVPMFTRKGLIGVLFGASRHEKAFNHSQMDLLAALGTQAAIAIENARLYEQEKITAEKLRTSMVTNEQLLRLVLCNMGLQAISDTVSELTSTPIIVEDDRHHLLYTSSPASKIFPNPVAPVLYGSADIWNDPELSNSIRSLRETRGVTRIPPRPNKGIQYSRIIVPVIAGDNLLGYVLAVEVNGEMNEQQRSAIEQARIVFALEFLKQEAAQAVEQRLAGDFLDDVINGRCTNDQSSIQRAARINVDLHAPHLVMILDVDRFASEIASHHWNDLEVLAVKRRFLQTTTEITLHAHPGSLVGMQSDSVLLLIPVARDCDDCLGIELARQIRTALQTAVPQLTISIGIGRVVKDYTGIPSSYRDAQIALQASASSKKRGSIIAYSELGVLPLLLQNGNQSDLVGFMHSTLDPLLSYDLHKQSDLLTTLRAYLTNSGHLQHTATDCHVHINTLKYRIQRIEEVLGVDLTDGNVRFNLFLATSIQDMLNLLESRSG